MSDRSARKRSKTIRTLFAAIVESIEADGVETLGTQTILVEKEAGGYRVRVDTDHGRRNFIYCWGPEGTLEWTPNLPESGTTEEEA